MSWNRTAGTNSATHAIVMTRPPRSFADAAVFAAPAVFVLLWASGFIGAKLGLPYAEPMTFLTVRMARGGAGARR